MRQARVTTEQAALHREMARRSADAAVKTSVTAPEPGTLRTEAASFVVVTQTNSPCRTTGPLIDQSTKCSSV